MTTCKGYITMTGIRSPKLAASIRALAAFFLPFCLLLASVFPATGSDLRNLTPDERAAFEDMVREYLMENPEVMIESLRAYEQLLKSPGRDMEMITLYRDEIFNSPESWSGGNPDGDVTVVEFIDYRCQFCRNMFDIVERVIASDSGVRFVIKEFPILGEESLIMAKVAIASRILAGDESYKEVHDLLMTGTGLDDSVITDLANRLGTEESEFAKLVVSDEILPPIEESYFLAEQLQINGTPAFIIGTKIYRGALTEEELVNAIEIARSEIEQG